MVDVLARPGFHIGHLLEGMTVPFRQPEHSSF